jgi:dipeptidase E
MTSDQIFLGGGGSEKFSLDLDRHFAAAVRETNCTRCFYVPHARTVDHFAYGRAWFTKVYGHLFDKVFLPFELNAVRPIAGTDAVYLGGGDTGRLLTAVRAARWDQALREHARAGGLIYGNSAGAIILGSSIESAPEAQWNAGSRAGLAIVHAVVVPHYEDGTASASQLRSLATSFDVPAWGIRENGGVVVTRDGQARSVGAAGSVAHPVR